MMIENDDMKAPYKYDAQYNYSKPAATVKSNVREGARN